MAFQIRKTVELATNAKSFVVTETTGAYSASNTGGYGTPNVATSSATASVIEITKWQDTTTYSVSAYSTFPSSARATFTINNTDIGLASTEVIADGVYLIDLKTTFVFTILSSDSSLETITLATALGNISGTFVAGDTLTVADTLGGSYTWTVSSATYNGTNTVITVTDDIGAIIPTLTTATIIKRSAGYELFFANGKACLRNVLKQIDVEECADCMNTKIELASKFNAFMLAAEYAASCGKANKATVILNYLNELCDLESCEDC